MKHLLAIEGLYPPPILAILDRADAPFDSRTLQGRTVGLRFPNGGRTRDAFFAATEQLGGRVVDIAWADETLTETAARLSDCDICVVRDPCSGVPALLARRVPGVVVNAGDGMHEHPAYALTVALTVRREHGRLDSLLVAISGDVARSAAARSCIHLFTAMGSRVRLIGPPEHIPVAADRLGVEILASMNGVDVVVDLAGPVAGAARLAIATAVLASRA